MRRAVLALLLMGCAGLTFADHVTLPRSDGPSSREYSIGMQEMAEHHYANAIASFRNAARQNPEWPRPWLGLAQVAELQHNDAEVRSALNKASALSPNDPEVARAWAQYNFKKGDLGAAETAFKHAAKLEPSAARLTDLGDFYAFQGRTEEAIETYRAAIAKDGSRAGIHFALANMLESVS